MSEIFQLGRNPFTGDTSPTFTKTLLDDTRPWGGFLQVVGNLDGVTVKIITVLPGHRLSMQKHAHRKEVWIVLTGRLTVMLGDDPNTVQQGNLSPQDFVEIDTGRWHQAANIYDTPVLFLEVALGTFDENDIQRHQDQYGRPDTPTTLA